ncbi:hypothetical protein F2Q68_00040754 [Brassica cretica]|uniref:Cupin type-1 domain-containing protein n=1 Tax=Brassica cretica TaxID=69181 RepID=A0A8S9MLK8_BRACR|nr:hypothetical protein F2Q68_00040754 [Brassica cretica]
MYGTAGIVLANGNSLLKERIVGISEGDFIAVPSGVVTWWFNDSSTDLTIVFFGQQRLTNFYLAGPRGVFNGFLLR